MKQLNCVLVLTLGLLIQMGCQTEQPAEVDTGTNAVDTDQASTAGVDPTDEVSAPSSASQETSNEQKEFVIDVRSLEEWETGHLDPAIHIPHGEIAEKIAEVTEDKSAKLVLY